MNKAAANLLHIVYGNLIFGCIVLTFLCLTVEKTLLCYGYKMIILKTFQSFHVHEYYLIKNYSENETIKKNKLISRWEE